MMKRLTTNLALWLMLAGIASFTIVYKTFGQHVTIEIASGMLFGGCVMIALTWLPVTLIGVYKGVRGGSEVLALAIFSIGTFFAIRESWTLSYRLNDRPAEWLEHWSYPLILWTCFWSIFVLILAPGTHAGEIPITNKIYMIFAGMIGMLFAGIAIGLSLAQSGFM